MSWVSRLLLVAWLALLAWPVAAAPAKVALVLTLEGPVNPVSARYVARGLLEAEARGCEVVVLQLDTPGGLETAMRDMVRAVLGSSVPVVVHVAPSGARAASAGMFLVLAAHVAAMAPNTTIGAAHPVAAGGEEIKGPMADKVTNDAAAYARGLAAQRGRNAAWAEEAVRKSVSLAAPEARRRGVVELVAGTLPELLAALDGRAVTTAAGRRVLATKAAAPMPLPMGALERFLLAISHPAIALVLLNIGMLGVFFELQNPGAVLPGIVGVIALLLGFFAMGMLPVSGVGLALLVFGMLLLAAELFVASYGVLAIGGVASLLLGTLMLFQPDPGQAAPWPLLLAITGTSSALALGALAFGLRAQARPVLVGVETLVGRAGEARTALAPLGTVALAGELWRARAAAPIAPGEPVVVERVDGLTLVVRPDSNPTPPATP